MTREEAYGCLYAHDLEDGQIAEILSALEQEPCNDAISREAVTNGEVIKKTFPHYDIEIDEHKGYVRVFYEDFYTTYPWKWWNEKYKGVMPSVQPSQKEQDPKYWIDQYGHVTPINPPIRKGHWIAHSNGGIWIKYYECSECHKHKGEKTDFCPNCGCRMVEPQESEDKE